MQLNYFNKELKQLKMKNKENVKISSKISSLNLYLDENGMIIAGGRLEKKNWHQQWLQASNTDGKGLPYLKICVLWCNPKTGHFGRCMTLNKVGSCGF